MKNNFDFFIDKELECYLHRWQKIEEPEIGFNAFCLMSDLYRRENFHSDILANLLDRNGGHGEKDLFLHFFIKTLNELRTGINISVSDFFDYSVEREKGKIDICIIGNQSRKAIIIENKINNAADMQLQIPRYYSSCVDRKLDVVAIVYWRLDRCKEPNMNNWSEEVKKIIFPLLIKFDTIKEGGRCLVNDVLKPALLKTNRKDVFSVLKQYITLLEFLDGTKQTYYFMNDFYNFIVKNEGYFQKMVELNNIAKELPAFFASKISMKYQDKDNCFPFEKTRVWERNIAVFDDFLYNNAKYAIDIICTLDGFIFQFFLRNGNIDNTEEILKKIGTNNTEKLGGRFSICFTDPDIIKREKMLNDFIDDFLEKLKNFAASN